MNLTPLAPDVSAFPAELRPFLRDARLFDASCSPQARVTFIEKDGGWFLKSAPKGALTREAALTRWFHGKGLAAAVTAYISAPRDWLLTEKLPGEDCLAAKYLENLKLLCDTLAERLALLHAADFSGCPAPDHTERYLARAEANYRDGVFDKNLFPDNWGYASAEEAFRVLKTSGRLLKTDVLLHGDYCLPNIILNDWAFSGFVDLDCAGAGDRHVDLFWALWTLVFNLKTDQYRERFIDAYGRGRVNEEALRVVAAAEVFL